MTGTRTVKGLVIGAVAMLAAPVAGWSQSAETPAAADQIRTVALNRTGPGSTLIYFLPRLD